MEFDKYRKFGAYHWAEHEQHTTYGVHADKVANWVKEDNILDIGAGDGLITHLLQEKGKTIIGIDDDETAVKLANEKGAPVGVMSAYKIEFPEEIFDAVLLADVIEHFEYPSEVIWEIYKVLRLEGMLYITTPPKLEGGGLHDKYHFREYSPKELVQFMKSLKFELVEPTEVKNVRIYAKFKKV